MLIVGKMCIGQYVTPEVATFNENTRYMHASKKHVSCVQSHCVKRSKRCQYQSVIWATIQQNAGPFNVSTDLLKNCPTACLTFVDRYWAPSEIS